MHDVRLLDGPAATIETCRGGFLLPPDNARPGVYWYFMDGNQDRDEMIADLHAMVAAGIGTILFLEVAVGIARGPIPFMSEEWQDNVVHAFRTAADLGMQVLLGTGPGWAGSGGGWVQPEDSMQHLVGGSIEVEGPSRFEQAVPLPPPHDPNPHAGLKPELEQIRNAWYRDVAVLAFPGGSRYRLLVLPHVASMLPETLRVIARLVEDGATIIGYPPRKSPSLVDYPACDAEVARLAAGLWGNSPEPVRFVGKGRVLLPSEPANADRLYPSYDALSQVLSGMGIPEDFHAAGPMRYGHRQTVDGDLYFVSNTSDQTLEVDCAFRVPDGQPELWDPVDGTIHAITPVKRTDTVTTLALRFAAYQSFFVVFKHGATGTATAAETLPVSQERELLDLGLAWKVTFDPARGGPGEIAFEKLQDWTEHAHPGVRYYSGAACYRKTFELSAEQVKGTDIYLDVGVVHDICRVRLNGKDVGTLWTAPWRLAITDAIQAGINELEIEVVNRWVNRLIGDQQPEDKDARTLVWSSGLLQGEPQKAGRYTYCTNSPYKADSPLLPAGLIGPVRVLVS